MMDGCRVLLGVVVVAVVMVMMMVMVMMIATVMMVLIEVGEVEVEAVKALRVWRCLCLVSSQGTLVILVESPGSIVTL